MKKKKKNLNLHSYHTIHFRLQARNAPPSSNQTGRIGRLSRSVGVSPLKPSPPRPGTTWIVVRRLPPTTWRLLRLAWACALPPSSDWVSYHSQSKLIMNIAVNYWLSIEHLIRMIIHAESLLPPPPQPFINSTSGSKLAEEYSPRISAHLQSVKKRWG